MQRRDCSVWLRIPSDVMDAIGSQARQNNVSLAEQISSILTQAIKMQNMAEQIVRMERQIKNLKEQKNGH